MLKYIHLFAWTRIWRDIYQNINHAHPWVVALCTIFPSLIYKGFPHEHVLILTEKNGFFISYFCLISAFRQLRWFWILVLSSSMLAIPDTDRTDKRTKPKWELCGLSLETSHRHGDMSSVPAARVAFQPATNPPYCCSSQILFISLEPKKNHEIPSPY